MIVTAISTKKLTLIQGSNARKFGSASQNGLVFRVLILHIFQAKRVQDTVIVLYLVEI